MICVAIKGPSFEDAHQQISKALAYADLVELRLDCFTSLDLTALKNLRTQFSIPMIFALRSRQHGGNYTQSEENRLQTIRQLIELKPEYLDLENHVSPAFIEEMQTSSIKLILSYHNFEETPHDLEGIYQDMQKTPAFFYKMAVTAQNSLDAFRFISWVNKPHDKLIAISMGSHGQVSRIFGPVHRCPITYAALTDDMKSAPGQLSAKTLVDQYHSRSLNPSSGLLGLIGDPVEQSISDHTHNRLMSACGFDAVYVKMQIKPSELSHFLQYAKQLPFQGMSVTMPLKEEIIPFLDCVDPQARDCGAVNTLLFEKGKISGFNTDGIGALNAIEKESKLKGKRIVMIGAGGAAKAIAYEACRRGGLVTILNRDPERALEVARKFDCEGHGLDYMPTCFDEGYDILINCTPVSMPISSDFILPHAIVMDIKTKPKETEFLKQAQQKGCRIIYGYQMFVEQALGQFSLWFNKRFSIPEGRKILEKEALERLI